MGATGPAPAPNPESQVTRAKLLHRFASRLEEIWLAAGKPSYRDLEKLDRQLPKSTISDVLRGKTAPTDRFLRAFIRACRAHSQKNGWHADGSIFNEQAMFDLWCQLQRELRRHRSRAVQAPARRPAEEPVHNRFNGCSTGCVAGNTDVVVLRRMLDALRGMNTA